MFCKVCFVAGVGGAGYSRLVVMPVWFEFDCI